MLFSLVVEASAAVAGLFVSNAENRAIGRVVHRAAARWRSNQRCHSFRDRHGRDVSVSDTPRFLQPAMCRQPATRRRWTVLEVDSALSALADVTGPGSARERVQQLTTLFRRATHAEQDFLRRRIPVRRAASGRARRRRAGSRREERGRACRNAAARRAGGRRSPDRRTRRV